ncbi:MAG: 2-C-methyl-D-erythritol 4-phosphate cytidylyltransferase [Planctomycetota bacterium]
MTLDGPMSVILPAAGKGRRFAADGVASASKIEFELAGRAAFLHAIDRFLERGDVGQIILAVDPDGYDTFEQRWGEQLAFMGVELMPGGRAERWETVQLALDRVLAEARYVAVHDAARPLASGALIERVVGTLQEAELATPAVAGVVPGLAVADSLKRVEPAEPPRPADRADDILGFVGEADPGDAGVAPAVQRITEAVSRVSLVGVQTPQVFRADVLREAYRTLGSQTADGITDDAGLVQRLGHPVLVVEGEPINFKITRPDDARLAEAWLSQGRAKAEQADTVRELFGDDDDD